MSIRVKFFASLREQVGRAEADVDAEPDMTVQAVWDRALDGAPMPGNVLVAVNMDYAEPAHSVCDGDEVAFFPPVTGG